MGATALLAGYLADISFGDPARFHPVAGFGSAAAALERGLYAPTRTRGVLLTTLAVGATAAGAELAARRLGRAPVLAALTWTALGGRSLRREATRVETLLARGELDAARGQLRALCGRDARELDAVALRRGVIESLAENSSDAVVAPLFWAAAAGPAGVAGYRAANTLDAMWGHRSERYRDFGWAPARLDDLLNVVPARITALLTVALGGRPAAAAAVWRRDAGGHPSPNAGPVEAAFAGALDLSLGGALSYGGRTESRPVLGRDGRAPGDADVARAVALSALVCGAAALLAAGWAR